MAQKAIVPVRRGAIEQRSGNGDSVLARHRAVGGCRRGNRQHLRQDGEFHRYARSPLTLPLLIGIAQTTVGVVVLAAVRAPDGAALSAVGWSLLSGVLFGLSGQALIRVLFVQEVSRTIPVMQTSPIFAAFIGMLFLDEDLSGVQWAAVAATVSGAAFLSLRLGGVRQGLFFHRSFFVLVAAAGVLAAANVAGKAALDDLPVLFTHGTPLGRAGRRVPRVQRAVRPDR